MKSVARISGITLAVISLLAIALIVATHVLSDRKQHRVVEVPVAPIVFAPTADARARGEYLYATRGCLECHGENGAGRAFINDAEHGLYIQSPNITQGPGSAARSYSDTDWVRLLRHGVKPSHRPVLVMPSEDYARLSDEDLAAIATHVRSLPAIAGKSTEFRLPLMMRAAYVLGAFMDAAEKIDHSLPPLTNTFPTATVHHGEYVASMCIGCHGPRLEGGKIAGAPPTWPPAANLTSAPDSAMSRYAAFPEFREMMRTGRRPDGSRISSVMPFESLRRMNDVEMEALFLYLKSLDAGASAGGER